ncbi:MAG: hypothetical protein IT167_08895 [Bryobacterales bacterium]|nr:hypothetical protein [Bryobacterales bacterium]
MTLMFKWMPGFLSCAAPWGQSSAPAWPVAALSAPGTAAPAPAPVTLTNLPLGFTEEIAASFSQRCMFTPVTVGRSSTNAGLECATLSGDPRLLVRQGTRLTRAGYTLLPNEQPVKSGSLVPGSILWGIDLLQDDGINRPAIQSLARAEDPQLTCTVGPEGTQLTRSVRSIVDFTFNEPLNVLYVETINSRTTFALPAQMATSAPAACPGPAFDSTLTMPAMQETTRTLVRVRGFNNASPPQGGVSSSAAQ